MKQRGRRLSLTSVNNWGILKDIKDIMPDAVLIARPVSGTSDEQPRGPNNTYWQGSDWVKHMLPRFNGVPAGCYYQFVNEWEGNGDPPEVVQRFNTYQTQVARYCKSIGITPTIGDWSLGTPGLPTIPREAHYLEIFNQQPDGCLNVAEVLECPVNAHNYAPEGDGATNMAAGIDSYFLRWETLAKGHPRLRIIGGEGGNAGKGPGETEEHMFRPQTFDCMKQALNLLRKSPYHANYVAVNWWEIVDPATHKDWSGDNWSDLLPAYFDWASKN